MATLASGPLPVSDGATGAEATLGAVILVVFVLAAGLQAYLVRTRRRVNGALRDCERRSRRLAESERALRAEQQRGRLVISSARDAYLSVDHAGIVIDWNHGAETTFGWRRHEIIGRPALDVLATERWGEVDRRRLEWMRRDRNAAMAMPVRTVARHRDGRDIPVEVSFWPVGTGDRTTFSAFLRDVTGRVETERELTLAQERAAEASRSRSEFLACVSHEIRTPADGVIGLSELLLDSNLDSAQRRYAKGISAAASSLLGVVNDCLDFARPESGPVKLEEVDFDPHDLVDGVIDLLAEPARTKRLELVGSTDPHLANPLRGDAGRLRQVLINLTSNAVKFTDSGRVVVRMDRTTNAGPERAAQPGSQAVQISVRDTGVGLSAEQRHRIFEPLSQRDGSRTHQPSGTGLGLTICRQIVAAMGGRIGVDSELGRGSTFWCEVPLARGRAQPDTDAGPSGRPGPSPDISRYRAVDHP